MACCDELVAKPATALALARQRGGELLAGDLPVGNQNVAKPRGAVAAVLADRLPKGLDRCGARGR